MSSPRSSKARSLIVLALLLSGCRDATVIDACLEEPERCLPCAGDQDCTYQGNACTETVYCAHVEAEIPVVQIGCSGALEYDWPEPESCICQEGSCHHVD